MNLLSHGYKSRAFRIYTTVAGSKMWLFKNSQFCSIITFQQALSLRNSLMKFSVLSLPFIKELQPTMAVHGSPRSSYRHYRDTSSSRYIKTKIILNRSQSKPTSNCLLQANVLVNSTLCTPTVRLVDLVKEERSLRDE